MHFATAYNIYSFSPVTVGGVTFNDWLAIRTGGTIRSPQLEPRFPRPLRLSHFPDLQTPSGDFFKKIQIVEQESAPSEQILPGLWFSADFADTVVGFQGKLYMIPRDQSQNFLAALARDGARVFADYESCDDPTTSITDEDIFISGDVLSKKSWANPSVTG